MIFNFFKNKSLSCEKLLGLFFILFLFYYLINFDLLNKLSSNDYLKGYKPEGIEIINQILNFELNKVNYFDTHFIVKLITGFLQKITSDELSFSITSNLLNMILLFLSMYFFFKSIKYEYSNLVVIIFLLIFFSYKANWIWCFRKLPDIYFLFNFSLIFYFVSKSFNTNKTYYFFFALIFCLLSLFIRPQGFLNIPFLVGGYLIFISRNRINLIKLSLLLFSVYLLIFPLATYIILKFDSIIVFNSVTQFMKIGKINGLIFYDFEKFVNDFSLNKNNFSELLFYYFLFIKKLIYLITFIREHYSISHNSFLIIYIFNIYLFLIINFNYLYREFRNFLELTVSITLISLLFHASLIIGSEPNRYQLFHLTPLYLLVSLSIFEKIIKKFEIFRYKKS